MTEIDLLPKCNVIKVRQARCDHCGKSCQFHWPRQKYCSACSDLSEREALPHQIERRRERMRVRMRKVRKGLGVRAYQAEVKCKDCTTFFHRSGPAQVRCEPCQARSAADGRKRDDLNKRIKRGNRLVGSTQSCRYCERGFLKIGINQAFCNLDCKAGFWRANPQWTINRRMSAGINGSLRNGAKAGRKWESLVGYSLTDLMTHLERQFLPGMGWGDRDRWDIDHVVPLAAHSFQTTDHPEFVAAWSLSNLRPLWKIDNIRKSARRLHLL